MIVAPLDVAQLLGEGDDVDLVALAGKHLPVVTAQVRAYTRGRGFTDIEPNADVAMVILTATARAVANPENVRSESIGDYSVSRQIVDGWTLAELAILNGYRKRAA